ncbi:hypothetical protein M8312_05260 [Sphingomonas sp. KRR8]|uniref:hypothetical protein n=1 Tax=Sphingomonas sp. KRR8 TaxID=2942996 RepID=UPI0020216E8F|nr:hypothetical protein [Sphingomonas sp. KRR8]URD61918.1 hypothetical protein M8312_05260 [Sphingomonas sp. KRR8]
MTALPEIAPALCRALAAEMREMSVLIEALAEVLASDEGVIARHLPRLQQFDVLAQHMGESASLLDTLAGGDCVTSAVEQVRLERLQTRLKAVLKAA